NYIDNSARNGQADGYHVYNGSLQEGDGRLGFWSSWALRGSKVSVTNEDNVRRLEIKAGALTSPLNPVIVYQKDLALTAGSYALSFDAEGPAGREILVRAAGQTLQATLDGSETAYDYKLTLGEQRGNDTASVIQAPGTYYIDNVRLEEDSLIKNGSFNAGFAGYELYAYTPADVDYAVDSLNEPNAAD